jgi:hypothetical protein
MNVENGILSFDNTKDLLDTRHIHHQIDDEYFGLYTTLPNGRFGFPILDDEAETFLKLHVDL